MSFSYDITNMYTNIPSVGTALMISNCDDVTPTASSKINKNSTVIFYGK